MSDNATLVSSWLKQNQQKYFCHNCLSDETGVRPVAQVNQIIRPLGQSREFRYMRTTCSRCSADRKCIGYFA